MAEEKKTVANIIIDRFLKDVDEKGELPWQRPYERYNAFNYFSKKTYRGINRLLLPFGEYITKNQINTYNKEHGYLIIENGRITGVKPEAYRFAKGIKWLPVVYFKRDQKSCSEDEVFDKFPDFSGSVSAGETVYVGKDDYWRYYATQSGYYKTRNILRYYEVADRKYFQNANGECLPSRLDTGEVVIELQEPQKVIDNYVARSGVKVDTEYADTPCYIPLFDQVMLNPHTKDQESWFATAFHEFGHSTGAANRLNRPGVAKCNSKEEDDQYAVEECIAEICACLCCAETGVYAFDTSGTEHYDNNLAYVQAWKKRIKDWGSHFVFIVSQADAAFNYICNGPDSENEEATEE